MRSLPIAAIILLFMSATLPGQSPDPEALARLKPGSQIRVRAEPIREFAPRASDILWRGATLSDVLSDQVVGWVTAVSPDSLEFMVTRGRGIVVLPWTSFEQVQVRTKNDPVIGAVKGAGTGLLFGVTMFAALSLMLPAEDGWDYSNSGKYLMLSTAGGALLGSFTMGVRWQQVYPSERVTR